MKTAPEADGDATPIEIEPTVQPQTEQHHGDLRKGAFLRRRANYQMQAYSPSGGQAGGIDRLPAAATSPRRKPR